MKLEVGIYVRGNYYQYRGKIGKIIKNYQNELEIAYKNGVIKTSVGDFIDDNWNINGKQFRKQVEYIKKDGGVEEYITIRFKENSGLHGNLPFPYFKKGTMYKNMELNEAYSLEELGL